MTSVSQTCKLSRPTHGIVKDSFWHFIHLNTLLIKALAVVVLRLKVYLTSHFPCNMLLDEILSACLRADLKTWVQYFISWLLCITSFHVDYSIHYWVYLLTNQRYEDILGRPIQFRASFCRLYESALGRSCDPKIKSDACACSYSTILSTLKVQAI